MNELVYATPFVVAVALLVTMVAGDRGDSEYEEELPLASAEHLAKLMRLRSVVVLGVIGAFATYGLVNEDLVIMMKFSSPTFAIVIVLASVRWVEAVRALWLLRRPGVAAERWGDVAVVRDGARRRMLRANAWLMRRALKHAIPRATL